MNKTAEQIYEIAAKKTENHIGQRCIINKFFRRQDDSHLWPINGRFSVVDRAIRRVYKIERVNGTMSNYEYALSIESEESNIVNDPCNY